MNLLKTDLLIMYVIQSIFHNRNHLLVNQDNKQNKDQDLVKQSGKDDKTNNSFITGLVAGSVGAFVVYPIDVVKTRMQNQNLTTNKLYNNGWDCWRKLWAQGRFGAFYRGCVPQMIGVAPEKAVKLFAYSTITSNLDKNLWSTQILAGLTAGTCQVMITSPYEMIKINLQMNNKMNYRELLDFKKLYTGASACFIRDIPFSGIYFPLYWYLKEKQNFNPFIAGTLAGIPSAFLCTPADVIKTRMQTLRKGTIEPIRMLPTANQIYKQEGWTAFWKGGGWRVLRSSPQFGVTLLVFENLKHFVL
jgi:solute carrier family 25 aspartate/glutamate transporter 12/13